MSQGRAKSTNCIKRKKVSHSKLTETNFHTASRYEKTFNKTVRREDINNNCHVLKNDLLCIQTKIFLLFCSFFKTVPHPI